MTNRQSINKTAEFVKQKFSGEGSGHDWWHMYRVWQLAKTIAVSEPKADPFVVELSALLHDIADWKFHDGDEEAGPNTAREWLESINVDDDIIEQVAYIVRHISFKGGTNKHVMQSIEGKIVQDADRLDGIGAIGIARTFAFGGAAGRLMYDPKNKPQDYASFDQFKALIKDGTTINHFYEKLLKLKDGMHTNTAKTMAVQRHEYMEAFLQEFYGEWNGKR